MHKQQNHIISNLLITGASSGIGEALSLAYAAPGITLGIIGRNQERLELVKSHCEQLGAEVHTFTLDIKNTDELMDIVSSFDRQHPLDLVIANAGATSSISGLTQAETWDDIKRVIDTNVYGTLATVYPVIDSMRQRGHGQIALMSSLSAYAAMPISPIYNGSKAAIKLYGESLRGWLAPQGVKVSVICPGFVKSAMSEQYPAARPFMISTEKAARIIQRGLNSNRARIAFPFPLNLLAWYLSLLPPSLNLYIQRFFNYTGQSGIK